MHGVKIEESLEKLMVTFNFFFKAFLQSLFIVSHKRSLLFAGSSAEILKVLLRSCNVETFMQSLIIGA